MIGESLFLSSRLDNFKIDARIDLDATQPLSFAELSYQLFPELSHICR